MCLYYVYIQENSNEIATKWHLSELRRGISMFIVSLCKDFVSRQQPSTLMHRLTTNSMFVNLFTTTI